MIGQFVLANYVGCHLVDCSQILEFGQKVFEFYLVSSKNYFYVQRKT